METIQELQKFKELLIQEIDQKFESMIQKLRDEQNEQLQSDPMRRYESIYSLNTGTGIFKGKRPTGVIFADGTRIDVPTWKRIVEEILRNCNGREDCHRKMMELRGKLLGRDRVLLGSEAGSMRSPLQIDRALFVETHYDTETLLRILTTRILNVVGYDYSEIRIAVRND